MRHKSIPRNVTRYQYYFMDLCILKAVGYTSTMFKLSTTTGEEGREKKKRLAHIFHVNLLINRVNRSINKSIQGAFILKACT